MTTNVNFDELAGKAFEPNATSDDYERLFAAVFSLEDWYFIADAKFEYKMPYCAIFPEVFGDETALAVFTDAERARKFIAESQMKPKTANGENQDPNASQTPDDLILRISTTGILDFFERLFPLGVTKIFFNPDTYSHGFHHDLKMMRPIYEHLESKGLLRKNEPEAVGENRGYNLAKLIEENADVITDFEREHEDFSALIGASAAAMTMTDEAGREQIVSKMAELLENLRNEYQMPPKLFRIYVETCLNERKLLMPVLGFAYLQEDIAKWEKLEQDKEFIDEYAKWTINRLVPGADVLMDEAERRTAETIDEKIAENDFQTNATEEKSSAESEFDFDALAKKAMETNAMEDLNELFGAAFALPKWNFISRGELPNVYPYVASNPAAAGNQPMIRAFTDTDRLLRFARENNLTEADGSAKMLTIPTENIVSYLEGFIAQGAYGVWFNSDSKSADFFIPIKQLQPIKDHLAKTESVGAATRKEKDYAALLLTVSDGLAMPSGFVSKSAYNCNFFCWIPREWTENLQLKNEYIEKLYMQFYGANWRAGNSDGSRYVVIESNSAVMSPERVRNTDWNVVKNTDSNQYWFYIGEGDGAFRNVAADEFQTHFDAYFREEKQNAARENQDRLADFGMSETADGDFEQNLTVNKVGAVDFDTSIAPFYEAIVPLLKDFQGTGDFLTLLNFEPGGKSHEVENIAENSHGKYLQIRRFVYLNPKNGVRIGVNSIHSNQLRRVDSNAELLVSFELCKNLDNQTAAFYHAFQGPKTDVLNLIAAIKPLLENVSYEAVQ